MFITVKAAEGNSHTPSSTDHSISVKSSMLREKNAKGRLVPTAHIHRRKDTHCPGKKHRGGHFQPKQKGGGVIYPKDLRSVGGKVSHGPWVLLQAPP